MQKMHSPFPGALSRYYVQRGKKACLSSVFVRHALPSRTIRFFAASQFKSCVRVLFMLHARTRNPNAWATTCCLRAR